MARPRIPILAIGANLMLAVVAFAAALAAGEVLVRWLRPQQLRRPVNLYQPADSIGYVHRPGLDVTINTGERPVRIITDRDGYRVGTGGRVEADTRVLLIGDSFVEAIEVAYEQSLAGLLQANLPVRLRRPVAVRDGGVSGYNPNHYRIAAERAFARERFDVMVVAVYTGNDIITRREASFRPVERSRPLRPRWPRIWSLVGFNRTVTMPLALLTLQHSHLAVLAWNATDLPRRRIGLWEYEFPRVLLESRASGPEWDVTADLCAEVAAVGARHGASVVFVVVPQYVQMDRDVAAAYARAAGLDVADLVIDQPNALLAERLRARGLEVIDALAPMRARFRAGTPMFGRFDRHLRLEGHESLRQLIEPWLVGALERRAAARSSATP